MQQNDFGMESLRNGNGKTDCLVGAFGKIDRQENLRDGKHDCLRNRSYCDRAGEGQPLSLAAATSSPMAQGYN
jgi:hypothetical protein